MENCQRLIQIFLGILLVWLLFGCAEGKIGEALGEDEDKPFEKAYFYEPGAIVNALGFKDSKKITLYRVKEGGNGGSSGALEPVASGGYMKPGKYTFAIEVEPRLDADEKEMSQRVFVSDGGWEEHVEAFPSGQPGYYSCDFTIFDTFLTHPILIQVIYPDSFASKKKYVVATRNDIKATSGKLVKEGLAITMSRGLLDSLKTVIEGMFSGATVNKFEPAHGDTGIFYLDMNMLGLPMNLDMALYDTKTNNGNTERSTRIDLEFTGDTGNGAIDAFIGAAMELIAGMAGLSEIIIPSISFPLGDMLAGLGGADNDGEDSLMADVMKNLQMDSTLFLNLYGLPEDTDSNYAVIGAGLYAADSNQVKTGLDDEDKIYYIWPDVDVDDKDTGIDIGRIKSTGTGLGIALSQYNLNQILGDMMKGFEVIMPAIELPILSPPKPSVIQTWSITITPGGIALDLGSQADSQAARLAVNDLRWVILENENPVTEISVDLSLDLGISIRSDEEGTFLDLSLTPDLDLCHIHILKDDQGGASFFDHSRMIQTLFAVLNGVSMYDMATVEAIDKPFVLPISLTDVGLVMKDDEDAGDIGFDGNGNCYMSLAVESLDLDNLPIGGGCFISAGLF